MSERTIDKLLARYSHPAAVLTTLGLTGLTAVLLNLPGYGAEPKPNEASEPNVVCTGSQPVEAKDYPTTTADGVFEARVKTPPGDDLKSSSTMKQLAKAIVTDPKVLDPEAEVREYHIPTDYTTQVRLDERYTVATYYFPEACYELSETSE